MLTLLLGIGANAQTPDSTFRKEGKTYSSFSKVSTTKSDINTGFVWKDSKGVEYPIFMGASGACYINKISNKTGKPYKQYLGKEVSADICKQLGKTYNPNR